MSEMRSQRSQFMFRLRFSHPQTQTNQANNPHLGQELILSKCVQPALNQLLHFVSRRLIATAKPVAVSFLMSGLKETSLDYVQMYQLFTNIWGF